MKQNCLQIYRFGETISFMDEQPMTHPFGLEQQSDFFLA